MDSNLIKVYYECERCEYKTKLYTDMSRHLNRKKNCTCIKKNYILTDEEYKERSLSKKYENYDEIIKIYNNLKKKEKEQIDNQDPLYWKDCEKRCDYCFNVFFQKCNLEKHIGNCKIRELVESKKKVNNTTNITTNNIINNTTNNINIIQNVTNINVNLDNKSLNQLLIPFYDKFDTTHISNETQLDLLLSTLYEDTLKEILKNDLNLNFYINNTIDNKSFVYVGDKNIERIDNDEIYSKIWLEIKNYLIDSLNKVKIEKDRYEKSIINYIEKRIKEKHEYIKSKDEELINKVKETINKIAKENEDKTINKFKILSNNLIEDKL